jgi:nitrite reductase/ring-hydroxylating ferredoxin subunit
VVTCAGHGYCFRAESGRGLNPATCSLAALPVHLEEGKIMVDLESVTEAGEA